MPRTWDWSLMPCLGSNHHRSIRSRSSTDTHGLAQFSWESSWALVGWALPCSAAASHGALPPHSLADRPWYGRSRDARYRELCIDKTRAMIIVLACPAKAAPLEIISSQIRWTLRHFFFLYILYYFYLLGYKLSFLRGTRYPFFFCFCVCFAKL
jgi:hypothetical protein